MSKEGPKVSVEPVPAAVKNQNLNQGNGNWGTNGVNIDYAKVHGNRGKQIAQHRAKQGQ